VVPGAALHDEIELMIAAGMPRPRVLRAATADAARFLGAPREAGVVEAGARADLLLVAAEADPLKIRRVKLPPWAGLLVASAMAACGSREPAKESTAAPPVSEENCRVLSSANHEHCGVDQSDAMNGCMAVVRQGVAAAAVRKLAVATPQRRGHRWR